MSFTIICVTVSKLRFAGNFVGDDKKGESSRTKKRFSLSPSLTIFTPHFHHFSSSSIAIHFFSQQSRVHREMSALPSTAFSTSSSGSAAMTPPSPSSMNATGHTSHPRTFPSAVEPYTPSRTEERGTREKKQDWSTGFSWVHFMAGG